MTVEVSGYTQLTLWGDLPGKNVFILVSGKAGVGKTTTAKFMQDYLISRGYEAELTAFAGAVKNCAREYFGWDGSKEGKGRELLQRIGTELGRWYNENLWVESLLRRLGEEDWWPDFVIVDDWRFPNEFEYLDKLDTNEVIRVRIEAQDREVLKGTDEESHLSEVSLPSALESIGYYDYVIFNGLDTSLENLEGMSKKVIDLLLERSKE